MALTVIRSRLARVAGCILFIALLGGALAIWLRPNGPGLSLSNTTAIQVNPEGLRRARQMEELMAGRADIGGPFTLTDHNGARRSLADFRGQLVLLYFGFTYCPDVCPTDLLEIAHLLNSLGERADQVQPLFITVDPERDTAEHLSRYLPHFHPRILGLTGSIQEIGSIAQRYRAYFGKVPSPAGGFYTVDHSANFYLVDREGKFAGSLPPGTKADRLADVIRDRLD